jgi:hypothetical protein
MLADQTTTPPYRTRLSRPARALLVLALVACDHAARFAPAGYAPDAPFGDAMPRRLTWNRWQDQTPAWSDDGQLLFYAYEETAGPVHDYCLAALPPRGGSRLLDVCPDTPGHQDSVDAWEYPAATRGRVAYLSSSSGTAQVAANRHALVVAPRRDLRRATTLRTFPYASADGPVDVALEIAWLDSTSLVYLAAGMLYPRACPGCPVDSLPVGRNIVSLELRSAPPRITELPGTGLASSLAVGEDGHTVFFTVMGDPRVFALDLATGLTTAVHDFGTGIARDVQVKGNRLVAVVGGRVTFAVDPTLGPMQRDEGGPLVAVDLTNGAETVIALPGYAFRRPALAPGGTRLVVEASATTAPRFLADLWLLEEP